MKSAAQRLLEIEPHASDRTVAIILAQKCVALTDAPYRFAINHDIRPPKNLACPVEYTWTRKDRCGIEIVSTKLITEWLTKSLIYGYTVYQMNHKWESVGFPHSIAIARRRAAQHQRPPTESDDDIPF